MKASSGKALKSQKLALVVHPDVGVLSSYQAALTAKGYVSILARDLATALLAITQHYFDIAMVSTRLQELGDGWPLAGVLHMVFPHAFVAVISPTEPDVLSLQAAINYGVREIYREALPAPEVVNAIVSNSEGPAAKGPRIH